MQLIPIPPDLTAPVRNGPGEPISDTPGASTDLALAFAETLSRLAVDDPSATVGVSDLPDASGTSVSDTRGPGDAVGTRVQPLVDGEPVPGGEALGNDTVPTPRVATAAATGPETATPNLVLGAQPLIPQAATVQVTPKQRERVSPLAEQPGVASRPLSSLSGDPAVTVGAAVPVRAADGLPPVPDPGGADPALAARNPVEVRSLSGAAPVAADAPAKAQPQAAPVLGPALSLSDADVARQRPGTDAARGSAEAALATRESASRVDVGTRAAARDTAPAPVRVDGLAGRATPPAPTGSAQGAVAASRPNSVPAPTPAAATELARALVDGPGRAPLRAAEARPSGPASPLPVAPEPKGAATPLRETSVAAPAPQSPIPPAPLPSNPAPVVAAIPVPVPGQTLPPIPTAGSVTSAPPPPAAPDAVPPAPQPTVPPQTPPQTAAAPLPPAVGVPVSVHRIGPAVVAPKPLAAEATPLGHDRLRADLVASGDGPTRLPAALPVATPLASPEAARAVSMQVLEALRQGHGTVEITLVPEELGRLRMTVGISEGAMLVTLSAERPETIDLMRRHIDILQAEARAEGFADLEFAFSGFGDRQDDAPQTHAAPLVPASPDTPTSTASLANEAGLDLRL